MKIVKQLLFIVLFVSFSHGFASEISQKLFVNLTSNEINRAAMAINFSTHVLMHKKMPVTIFLNVEAVRIADKNIKGSTYVNGKTLQEMLMNFMELGGQVIICPMCMKNVGGLSKEELIDGVKIGGPDVTFPALFDENTVIMSY